MNVLRSARYAAALAMLCTTGAANASLIGDTITFNTYFPTAGDLSSSQSLLVGPGIECAACPSGGFVLTDQTLDIGADFIEFSSSFETSFSGPNAIFEFLDLDWLPVPGALVDFVLTTDFANVTAADVSFTADSIAIDIGNSGNGTGWRLDLITRHAVPEPATVLLVGLGIAGLGAGRLRRRATAPV